MARRSIRKRRHNGFATMADEDRFVAWCERPIVVQVAAYEQVFAPVPDIVTFEEVWRREYPGSWPNEIAGKIRVVSIDRDSGGIKLPGGLWPKKMTRGCFWEGNG